MRVKGWIRRSFNAGKVTEWFKGAAVAVILLPLVQQSAPWLAVGLLDGLNERFTFNQAVLAESEQLRKDLGAVVCGPQLAAFQGLILRAEEWNMRRAHEIEGNAQFNLLVYAVTLGYANSIADLLSTDRWNDLDPILLPCGTSRITSR